MVAYIIPFALVTGKCTQMNVWLNCKLVLIVVVH